ncbi:ATP-dependent DNA helicase [Trichonephila clavipes]|nr:ATP-dependent DNA helicase [Trichonephila clavipes]
MLLNELDLHQKQLLLLSSASVMKMSLPTLFYHQVPRYNTWDSKNKKWSRQKIGQSLSDHPGFKSTDAIGRVYTVHPNNSEWFHLRLLLYEVPGPTSFQYLKTIEGRI